MRWPRGPAFQGTGSRWKRPPWRDWRQNWRSPPARPRPRSARRHRCPCPARRPRRPRRPAATPAWRTRRGA
ncbi:hypothetical protein F1599_10475 [Cupriavidus cauae]|uniref:Uncharacterized protein n=1 Tax=Cupriavidus cauae TaxID=2608999 RepID=A0A5M8ATR5_9BURK|nr:hypothetical protein F1599_10475 [Cupriavidus cauae]